MLEEEPAFQCRLLSRKILLFSSVLTDILANNGFYKVGSMAFTGQVCIYTFFFFKQPKKFNYKWYRCIAVNSEFWHKYCFGWKEIQTFFETITVNMIEDRDSMAKSNINKIWWKSISSLGTYCLQYSRTKDIQNKSSAHSWEKQRYRSIARINFVVVFFLTTCTKVCLVLKIICSRTVDISE